MNQQHLNLHTRLCPRLQANIRVYLVLILAAFILLASSDGVFGSSVKLRSPQSLLQPINAGKGETNRSRVLRIEGKTDETIAPDEEERGAISNLRNKFNQKALSWLKSKELARSEKAKLKKDVAYVKSQALFENLDDAVKNLMKKGITPDDVHKWLRLDKEKNRWMSLNRNSPLYQTPTPQSVLFDKLRDAVRRQHRNK